MRITVKTRYHIMSASANNNNKNKGVNEATNNPKTNNASSSTAISKRDALFAEAQKHLEPSKKMNYQLQMELDFQDKPRDVSPPRGFLTKLKDSVKEAMGAKKIADEVVGKDVKAIVSEINETYSGVTKIDKNVQQIIANFGDNNEALSMIAGQLHSIEKALKEKAQENLSNQQNVDAFKKNKKQKSISNTSVESIFSIRNLAVRLFRADIDRKGSITKRLFQGPQMKYFELFKTVCPQIVDDFPEDLIREIFFPLLFSCLHQTEISAPLIKENFSDEDKRILDSMDQSVKDVYLNQHKMRFVGKIFFPAIEPYSQFPESLNVPFTNGAKDQQQGWLLPYFGISDVVLSRTLLADINYYFLSEQFHDMVNLGLYHSGANPIDFGDIKKEYFKFLELGYDTKDNKLAQRLFYVGLSKQLFCGVTNFEWNHLYPNLDDAYSTLEISFNKVWVHLAKTAPRIGISMFKDTAALKVEGVKKTFIDKFFSVKDRFNSFSRDYLKFLTPSSRAGVIELEEWTPKFDGLQITKIVASGLINMAFAAYLTYDAATSTRITPAYLVEFLRAGCGLIQVGCSEDQQVERTARQINILLVVLGVAEKHLNKYSKGFEANETSNSKEVIELFSDLSKVGLTLDLDSGDDLSTHSAFVRTGNPATFGIMSKNMAVPDLEWLFGESVKVTIPDTEISCFIPEKLEPSAGDVSDSTYSTFFGYVMNLREVINHCRKKAFAAVWDKDIYSGTQSSGIGISVWNLKTLDYHLRVIIDSEKDDNPYESCLHDYVDMCPDIDKEMPRSIRIGILEFELFRQLKSKVQRFVDECKSTKQAAEKMSVINSIRINISEILIDKLICFNLSNRAKIIDDIKVGMSQILRDPGELAESARSVLQRLGKCSSYSFIESFKTGGFRFMAKFHLTEIFTAIGLATGFIALLVATVRTFVPKGFFESVSIKKRPTKAERALEEVKKTVAEWVPCPDEIYESGETTQDLFNRSRRDGRNLWLGYIVSDPDATIYQVKGTKLQPYDPLKKTSDGRVFLGPGKYRIDYSNNRSKDITVTLPIAEANFEVESYPIISETFDPFLERIEGLPESTILDLKKKRYAHVRKSFMAKESNNAEIIKIPMTANIPPFNGPKPTTPINLDLKRIPEETGSGEYQSNELLEENGSALRLPDDKVFEFEYQSSQTEGERKHLQVKLMRTEIPIEGEVQSSTENPVIPINVFSALELLDENQKEVQNAGMTIKGVLLNNHSADRVRYVRTLSGTLHGLTIHPGDREDYQDFTLLKVCVPDVPFSNWIRESSFRKPKPNDKVIIVSRSKGKVCIHPGQTTTSATIDGYDAFGYTSSTSKGDCGSFVYDSGGKVTGIHFYGTKKGVNYFAPVTEGFSGWFAKQKNLSPPASRGGVST